MEPLTESEIRSSFVNCSKGEAKRLNLPDLRDLDWENLDFLGWVDPKAPLQAILVTGTPTGPVGVQLRRNTSGAGPRRAKMCSLCLTTHPGQGVSLMVARRAGQPGRDGNTVGLDICADLECSLYTRGLRPLPTMSAAHETLSVEDRIARLELNLRAFLERVRR
ncbi:FBP domain-containing protein [Nocardioides daejeonensis]|uniref:FBP domain-containing protein n=1 Tax=Nocardioides daejeonensis TaxID=1046556 RepID=UPI000D74545A|nr:FBP domain-containing protein [Nocardioides daejeonensis]